MPGPSKDWKGQKGLALPGVVWAVLVLFLMTAAVLNLTLGQARQISAEEQIQKRELAVEAAFATAIKGLIDDKSGDKQTVLGSKVLHTQGDYEVSVSISAEAGKINLNLSSKKLLTALFVETGLSRAGGDALAETIFDYRKGKRPFRALGEVLEIRGMDHALYEQIFPDITLYSNSPAVRPEYASDRLLKVLAAAGENFAPGASVLKPAEFETGTTWRLEADIKSRAGATLKRVWIIRLTGDDEKPYLLHWMGWGSRRCKGCL